MRTFGLILAATVVAAVNAAGIKHDSDGNIVVSPSKGTTIFMDASVEGGATSIQMMSAKIMQVDDARAELSATVTQQLADAKVETAQSVADMQTEMATQAQEVTDQLAETREQVDEDLSAAVETSKNYADNAIENTVTPALAKVASDLVALEEKIKKDIDEDIKTTLDKYEKVLMGTSTLTPAANCEAIRSAQSGAQVDGAYYVVSKYQSAAVKVWCANVGGKFISLGGDCKSKATACASCSSNYFNNPGRFLWVDPDANADDTGNSKSTDCEPALMVKLVTTDNHIAEYESKFWTSTDLMKPELAVDGKWQTATDDIKGPGYLTAIGKVIEIVASVKNKEVGRAIYNVKAKYQDKSLKWLLADQGTSNLQFADRDNGKSAKNRPMYSKHMYRRGGNRGQRPYDMFLDTTGHLVAKQRNYGGSQNSWSRLSTTDRSGWTGCHVYTGIGGDHYCNGWRIQYEASPIVGYCSTYNRYGSNHKNSKGGPTPNSNCGGAKRQTDVEFAILKKK